MRNLKIALKNFQLLHIKDSLLNIVYKNQQYTVCLFRF